MNAINSLLRMMKSGTHATIARRTNPTTHMRNVRQGISGSSIFDTDARTSAYGLSSSSMPSKSNSILKYGDVSFSEFKS